MSIIYGLSIENCSLIAFDLDQFSRDRLQIIEWRSIFEPPKNIYIINNANQWDHKCDRIHCASIIVYIYGHKLIWICANWWSLFGFLAQMPTNASVCVWVHFVTNVTSICFVSFIGKNCVATDGDGHGHYMCFFCFQMLFLCCCLSLFNLHNNKTQLNTVACNNFLSFSSIFFHDSLTLHFNYFMDYLIDFYHNLCISCNASKRMAYSYCPISLTNISIHVYTMHTKRNRGSWEYQHFSVCSLFDFRCVIIIQWFFFKLHSKI